MQCSWNTVTRSSRLCISEHKRPTSSECYWSDLLLTPCFSGRAGIIPACSLCPMRRARLLCIWTSGNGVHRGLNGCSRSFIWLLGYFSHFPAAGLERFSSNKAFFHSAPPILKHFPHFFFFANVWRLCMSAKVRLDLALKKGQSKLVINAHSFQLFGARILLSRMTFNEILQCMDWSLFDFLHSPYDL